MHSVLGNHKTMIQQYTVIVVIHVYNRIIVFTQHISFWVRRQDWVNDTHNKKYHNITVFVVYC